MSVIVGLVYRGRGHNLETVGAVYIIEKWECAVGIVEKERERAGITAELASEGVALMLAVLAFK